MDAVMYLKEKERMLKTNEYVICNIECEQCPLSRERNGEFLYCSQLEFLKTEKIVEIVETWSKEHPQKTYMMDFFEKFPNATKHCGKPEVCLRKIYGEKIPCPENTGCSECWNRPMPEVVK